MQRRLATTETALVIMGKRMRSWSRPPRARSPTSGAGALTVTYIELTDVRVTTRAAAELTRSTTTRRRCDPDVPAARPAPANRLSPAERLGNLAVLDQPRFADLPPIQIWATLLDECTYLCSVSTMYRILAEHAQLVERRRIAATPPGPCPSSSPRAPARCTRGTSPLAGPAKGLYY